MQLYKQKILRRSFTALLSTTAYLILFSLFVRNTHASADQAHSDDLYQFKAESTINIDVDLPLAYGERAFINICRIREDEHSDQHCYLKTPLNGGKLKTRIAIDDATRTLVAEIFFFREGMEPVQIFWKRRSQQTWRIR